MDICIKYSTLEYLHHKGVCRVCPINQRIAKLIRTYSTVVVREKPLSFVTTQSRCKYSFYLCYFTKNMWPTKTNHQHPVPSPVTATVTVPSVVTATAAGAVPPIVMAEDVVSV